MFPVWNEVYYNGDLNKVQRPICIVYLLYVRVYTGLEVHLIVDVGGTQRMSILENKMQLSSILNNFKTV